MLLRDDQKPNGCSFFPEGEYTSCCNAHDMAYLFGKSRSIADLELRKCIIRCGKPITAWIVWIGVRLFGYPFWILAKIKVKRARKRKEQRMKIPH